MGKQQGSPQKNLFSNWNAPRSPAGADVGLQVSGTAEECRHLAPPQFTQAQTPGRGAPRHFNRSFPKTRRLHRGSRPPDRCGIQEQCRRRILETQPAAVKLLRASVRPRLRPPTARARGADGSIACIPPASLCLWGSARETSRPCHNMHRATGQAGGKHPSLPALLASPALPFIYSNIFPVEAQHELG